MNAGGDIRKALLCVFGPSCLDFHPDRADAAAGVVLQVRVGGLREAPQVLLLQPAELADHGVEDMDPGPGIAVLDLQSQPPALPGEAAEIDALGAALGE